MMTNMNKSISHVDESPPAYETVIEAIEIDMDLLTYCEAVRCMQEQNKTTELRKELQGLGKFNHLHL